ncbi:hypothetical protein [Ructibacterium gallinarum]|uniref:Uncharacterized protein n=1 Tax=Ructibacterium gallinarum TaxID=2779355 RepID=A0A9D5LXS1_9FIRM|nr:hypothetical protein [Ructibacterium gallinarum]MBE5039886.1 hypothetical protein [Ructibacterium gallinarum]
MELRKVMEVADALCPNPYTMEEKLRWCDEVSAGIRREIKKIYDTIETTVTQPGELTLPEDISFEDIEVAYLDGKPMDKVDFRSFAQGELWKQQQTPVHLKLVFLTRHQPVRCIKLTGTFDVGENFIKMDQPPFYPGDCIEWVEMEDLAAEPDWTQANRCYVIDLVYDGLMVEDGAFSPQTGAKLAMRRVIDDLTEIDELPYDNMYVEYLLAKMALYQHDYTGYSAHMTQYNTLYEGLRRDYKNRSPLNEVSRFHKYWQD